MFNACPHLPTPPTQMDWRAFNLHGSDRGADFYLTALNYAHHLWQRGLAARAILCLDRALLADIRGDEPVLAEWPLPYTAMVWVLQNTPAGVFIGNPRVHFQHLADRMNEPRREQRRWRTWACWALSRAALPHLPGDPNHKVSEPTIETITEKLRSHDLPGEAERWLTILHAISG